MLFMQEEQRSESDQDVCSRKLGSTALLLNGSGLHMSDFAQRIYLSVFADEYRCLEVQRACA